jgi:hypothetical protein
VQRAGADPTLVLVTLGGDQLAVTPEDLQAHLASRFRVSVGTAGACAWLRGPFAQECLQGDLSSTAMHGGGQAVRPEPELAVVRCLEFPCRDFDPMLVEVDACLAKPQAGLTHAVSEVEADECGLGLMLSSLPRQLPPAIDSTLDPMLVEVEVGLRSQAVSEVALVVDLCLSGPDDCDSGQTSLRPSHLLTGWGIPTLGPSFSHAGC